jgi:hypothetical protein
MNYIRHLYAFYHQVKRDDRLSPTHVSLYLAIFQYWNYNRFQNPFRIDKDELMLLSKIGSKNTYYKCLKDLHSYRYIIYHTGITKFQNRKISVVRLEPKPEEKGLKQLNLFCNKETEKVNGLTEIHKVQNPCLLQAPKQSESLELYSLNLDIGENP